MNDDYLWDRSGPEDPEIAELERLLAPLRYEPESPSAPSRRWFVPTAWATTAAAVVVAILVLMPDPDDPTVREPFGRYAVTGLPGRDHVMVGDEFVVGDGKGAAQVSLDLGYIGTVDIAPGSKVSVIDAGDKKHYLYLASGAIDATISAAGANKFQIGTPAGLSVDLGCGYRIEVENGRTRIEVGYGMVSFEAEGRKVFVPGGAECRTTPGQPPSAPVWADHAQSFKNLIATLDGNTRLKLGPIQAAVTLHDLAEARDSLSLWHLLQTTEGEVRKHIVDCLGLIAPPPEGVTLTGVMRGDAIMLDAWREHMAVFW